MKQAEMKKNPESMANVKAGEYRCNKIPESNAAPRFRAMLLDDVKDVELGTPRREPARIVP